MYITENQNLGESVLFMLSARNSLAEMVEDSGHDSANVMINFLINEATDLEIMSLLVEGKISEEKYNEDYELALFSHLKEQVLANHETISEMVGAKTFSDFMTKVDSVYPKMSTVGPMLEFYSAQDPQIATAMLLTERPRFGASKAAQGPRDEFAAKGSIEKAGARAPKSEPMDKEGSVSNDAAAKPDLGKPSDYGASTSGKGATTKGGDSGGGEPSDMYGGSSKNLGAGGSKSGLHAANRPDTGPHPPGYKMADTELHGLAAIKAHMTNAADAVSAFAKSTPGLVVGGAALAALLAYGAAKTYKRFFSKAAGACRGMGGGAKSDCMNKYRGRAIMAQAADLQRGMASCGKAKNPASCKSAVGGKIERLKAKARQIAG